MSSARWTRLRAFRIRFASIAPTTEDSRNEGGVYLQDEIFLGQYFRWVVGDRADDDVDRVFLETLELAELRDRNQLTVDKQGVESLALRPARDVGVKSFPRLNQRCEHLERPAFHRRLELADDGRDALFLDR